MGFSIPPGMTLEQMLRVMAQPPAAEPIAEPDELFIPAPAPVKLPRKRAHTAEGKFQADDPATPENEAWEPAAES